MLPSRVEFLVLVLSVSMWYLTSKLILFVWHPFSCIWRPQFRFGFGWMVVVFYPIFYRGCTVDPNTLSHTPFCLPQPMLFVCFYSNYHHQIPASHRNSRVWCSKLICKMFQIHCFLGKLYILRWDMGADLLLSFFPHVNAFLPSHPISSGRERVFPLKKLRKPSKDEYIIQTLQPFAL